ncbi:MAG TPA: hypothetical protein VHC46_05010, partial [Thermodesulfobacteriota bacterium]|nr:hypothetical protein [Thermodesulfobacteriota bacterium]
LTHIIPNATEDVVRRYEKGYKVRGRKLNIKVANFVPWYSLSLLLMGVFVARIAKVLNQKNVTFSLDHLPGNTKAAMDLIKIISQYPTNFNAWKKAEENSGVRFELGNPISYTNHAGVSRDANLLPGMVLVDWIVHSIYCAKNELVNIDNGKRTDLFKERMTKPYEALIKGKQISLFPFYGIEFANNKDEIDNIIKENDLINFYEAVQS